MAVRLRPEIWSVWVAAALALAAPAAHAQGNNQLIPQGYAEQPPGYAGQPPGYGEPRSVDGAQPPGYGVQPPGYGGTPLGYGYPRGGSSQQPPGYGVQPPGYGQPPPGYGAAPGYGQGNDAYGKAPPGNGIPPKSYGVAPPGYGAAPGNSSTPHGYGDPGPGYGQAPGYGVAPTYGYAPGYGHVPQGDDSGGPAVLQPLRPPSNWPRPAHVPVPPAGQGVTYHYDKAGNFTGATETIGNLTREYNANGQVVHSFMHDGSRVVVFDGAGEVVQHGR